VGSSPPAGSGRRRTRAAGRLAEVAEEAAQWGRLAGTLKAGATAGARSSDARVAATEEEEDVRERRSNARRAYVLNHDATTFSIVHTWHDAMGHGAVVQ
jgi:hypothetical protein